MKSAGMDATRITINCRMTSVLWVFLLLIYLRRPTLVYSQDTTGPTATIKILPESTTEPREGDSVTLDCEISSIQQPGSVLWTRRSSIQDPQAFIVDENGLTQHADSRFSVSSLQVVSSTAALYSHKITIDPLRQSDQGYYQCHVQKDNAIIARATEIKLIVHHPDEFPVCTPDGPATVTIDSSLSCKTLSDTRTPIVSDTRMPTSTNDGWVRSPTNAEGSPGQELVKTVTDSEHGKTFQCFSTSNVSVMALACYIGPLTVVSETTRSPIHGATGTVNTNTIFTATDKQQSVGLSGADIAGIVVGVILLLIIIAVHTLCCRCNPKRCLYAKSYPFNTGSSFGFSRERGDTVRTQPDMELGNSEPQTNNVSSSSHAPTEYYTGTTTPGSGTIENLQPAPTPDPLTSEQHDPQSIDPKPKTPAIYAQVKKTTAGTDTDEPTGPKPPAFYAQVNKTTPVTDTKESTERDTPAVYAKVTKTTPETDTSEPINSQPDPSVINSQMDENASQDDAELLKENSKGSSYPQKVKNIKRFGQDRNGQVSSPPKHEPAVIYADLDLQGNRHDEVCRPPSDDSQTVYAVIKH